MRHYSGIVNNDSGTELMLVINITPAVSVSIADLGTGNFLNEISTAGCGLVYPVEGLKFLQLCGDGSAQLISMDTSGQEISRSRSTIFFDLQDDPLMEKPVQTSDGWLFNTFKGKVFTLKVNDDQIQVESRFTIEDDSGRWRIGGMQPLAYHRSGGLLLVLMHEGGEGSHKDPGTEIWFYDLATQRRSHRLQLAVPTTSIQISQDDAPLIYAASLILNQLDIYDLQSAKLVATITDIGFPTILQNF